MMPSVIIPLDSAPLTSNGKVDWKRLPAPDSYLSDQGEYVEPSAGLEMTVASIWRELLKVEKVGTRDNFFDLGGHSLLIAQLHGRLREVLGQDLSMMDLFQYPTISSFVSRMNQSEDKPSGVAQVESRLSATNRQREQRQRYRTQTTGRENE
jgi:acyl carrier protein